MADTKTYTAEEYDALSAQVEDLQAKVAELTAVAGASEAEARIATATAELDEQVADLQSKLDAAVLEAETAKKAHDDLVSYLESEEQAKAEAAAYEARKSERIAQVKEVASFSDDYVEANADRWAGMSEESFTASLEDWKAIAAKASETATSKTDDNDDIPATTAMTASESRHTNTDALGAVREVFGLAVGGESVKSI